MTSVSSYTEIVKRHHAIAPIEHGVLADVEMLAHIARQETGSTYDDAARLIPDDEYVHLVWEEVVDKNWQSELDEFSRWLGISHTNIEIMPVLGMINEYRESRRK